MLRTSSGDRAAEAEEGSELLLAGAGVAAAAAVRAATIPGARFARGTLRGRPALVVWTEAAWSVAGAGAGASGAEVGAVPWARVAPWAAAGWPARSARRLDRPGGGGEAGAGASGWPSPGDGAAANGVAPPGGGPDAPGVRVGSDPVRPLGPVRSRRDLVSVLAVGPDSALALGPGSALAVEPGSALAVGPGGPAGAASVGRAS